MASTYSKPPFDLASALDALALALEDLALRFGLSVFGGLVPGAHLSDLQAEAEGGQNWSKQTKTMVAPTIPHISNLHSEMGS